MEENVDGFPIIVTTEDLENFGCTLKLMVFCTIRSFCVYYKTDVFNQSIRQLSRMLNVANNSTRVLKIVNELVDDGFLRKEKGFGYGKNAVSFLSVVNFTAAAVNFTAGAVNFTAPNLKAPIPAIPLFPPPLITNITQSVKTDTEKNTITHCFPKGETFMLSKYNSTVNGKGLLSQTVCGATHHSKKSLSFTDTTKRLFDEFWNAYPPRQAMNRRKCWNVWCKLPNIDENGETIITALKNLKISNRWNIADGRYIPYCLNFLQSSYWVQDQQTQGCVNEKPKEEESTLEEFESLGKELGLFT